jgi:CheY-like chemotaxis protein
MMMPKMDGLETCRRLRSDPATRDIPIIMVTTRGEPASVEAGYTNGCSDYVTKPIDRVELLSKISSLLGLV